MRRLVHHAVAGVGFVGVTAAVAVAGLNSPAAVAPADAARPVSGVAVELPASRAERQLAADRAAREAEARRTAEQAQVAATLAKGAGARAGTLTRQSRAISAKGSVLQKERKAAEAAAKARAEAKAAAARARKAKAKAAAAKAKAEEARARAAAEAARRRAAEARAIEERGYTSGTTDPREIARQILENTFGYGADQFSCFDDIIVRESNWDVDAVNRSSGAYGIPQALPGAKMASAGSDWRTNPATQITWAVGYMDDRYGSPCEAWTFKRANGWY